VNRSRPGLICALFCSLTLTGCSQDKPAAEVPEQPDNQAVYVRFDAAAGARKAALLDTFFRQLGEKRIFNGTVLVAQAGHVIYKGAFGYKDLTVKDTLTTATPFQLASVSKQFTAVAVMQLKEKGLLDYDDPVYKFIPNFPYDSSITIRLLLTHRSGLPGYQYSLEKHVDRRMPLTNQEVVAKLCALRPAPYYPPNRKFNYNNTNYVLLAAIVERLTGKSFRQYADDHLFKPLQMRHTFVYDGSDTAQVRLAATGYTGGRRSIALDYLDSVTGDKSVYSTVEDLFKWDRGLYTSQIIRQQTLEEAFRPAHQDANLITKNYGFGWRLQKLPDNDWLTFHTGWWHGFKNYFMRSRPDQTTVILLSNVANSYLSNVGMVNAILYPERARFFLRGDMNPEATASADASGTNAMGEAAAPALMTLADFNKLRPTPPPPRKVVRKPVRRTTAKGRKPAVVRRSTAARKPASRKR
jgi:CubicO group peptidase (beta-lactamase class C family)